ncbi:MAG: hypothetical protein GX860_11140 [Alcaligenaceae bacterium]|nr:hypothetical protein [Alcaligenaceae bacterium]
MKAMIRTMQKALEYTISKDENPAKMKEYVEEYLATAGFDRRFKFKWRAFSGNSKYIFSGIFEYAGQRYYFHKKGSEIKLERI